MEVIAFSNHFNNNIGETEVPESHDLVLEALSKRFEEELRRAKRVHLACGEVLIPNGLTRQVAKDIYQLADAEPYGLKGCTIYINFESNNNDNNTNNKRNLSVVHCDPTTPSTFELYLTLKQVNPGWNHFLPQFLKKMTRGGTVVISSDYDLEKRKLYRSYDD